ncbi:MAG: flavin reductase family protein [Bacteroidota bacterium]
MVFDPKKLSPRETYNLLVSAVVPRPIAFITTLSKDERVNAAPYSFFNAITSSPPLVMISAGRKKGAMKHTAENILGRKEFVINIITETVLHSMKISSADFPTDIEQTNLSLLPSISIATPRIAESPVQFECVLYRHIEVGNEPADLIIGEVARIHVKDELYSKGAIDQHGLRPIARMGENYYATIEHLFEIDRYQPNKKKPGRRKTQKVVDKP